MRLCLVLGLVLTACVGAATRPYEVYRSEDHDALPFATLAPRAPPAGFEVRKESREVVNPADESDQTWRARAGVARARYVLKGDVMLAALPAASGVEPYEYEPLTEAEFLARRLVILAPYDVETRRYSIEVFLGDSEREWFPLPRKVKDPRLRTVLRTLLVSVEGKAEAPTWDETAAFLERLRSLPGLLHGLYLESFGEHPPKPEPRRR
jgi:hypothetical protein